MEPTAALIEAFRASTAVMVVTGAGMGLASGIPTFRGKDPGAVWANDVMTKGTRRYYESDPVGSWTWYLGRFDGVQNALPNAGHHALAAIGRRFAAESKTFVMVTQNIDGLHAAAGSSAIEVHGSAHRVRCARNGCANAAPHGTLPFDPKDFQAFRVSPSQANIPRCGRCGGMLRPHVLWFDEYYGEHHDYRFAEVYPAAKSADVILFVGTSFSVGVTFGIVEIGLARGVPMFSIDPSAPAPHVNIVGVRESQEDVLPRLAGAIGASRLSGERGP